ncbi:hypothetical protein MYX64_06225 [Nitrospinae bacterium AH_259_B05_G02_I21]|nr:hypothetical protein [Nitrospinae bacterium AH_259_B05_G02_I21]MDA2932056.1 hypothetical protein [Nitrospinae bacterium AH-259-F20]
MSNEEITFEGLISPLLYMPGEEHYAKATGREATLESIVDFLCTHGLASDLPSLVSRYQEISIEEQPLNVTPIEPWILEKLVWPLRHAKGSYILGNYLGTIALCGIVAEMVAMLLFDISKPAISGKPMDKQKQEELFGYTFENLGQYRRVGVLQGLGLIDSDLKDSFEFVRITRTKYLHHSSKDHTTLPGDAVAVFIKTVSLVVGVMGQDIKDGKLILGNKFIQHLRNLDAAKEGS